MPITAIPSSAELATNHGRTSIYTIDGFAETFSISGDFAAIATTTAFMLVDLSDTTNWPHTNTDHIVIDYIILEAEPTTSFRGTIELGYLLNVDATNGDFVEVNGFDFTQKSDVLLEAVDFGSHGLHCTNNHHFGLTTANNTLFQTDVNLEGPDGNTSYPSGAGDLILFVTQTAGTVDVEVTIGYETVA